MHAMGVGLGENLTPAMWLQVHLPVLLLLLSHRCLTLQATVPPAAAAAAAAAVAAADAAVPPAAVAAAAAAAAAAVAAAQWPRCPRCQP
jgi:predicted branched-subunit amino acid permease